MVMPRTDCLHNAMSYEAQNAYTIEQNRLMAQGEVLKGLKMGLAARANGVAGTVLTPLRDTLRGVGYGALGAICLVGSPLFGVAAAATTGRVSDLGKGTLMGVGAGLFFGCMGVLSIGTTVPATTMKVVSIVSPELSCRVCRMADYEQWQKEQLGFPSVPIGLGPR